MLLIVMLLDMSLLINFHDVADCIAADCNAVDCNTARHNHIDQDAADCDAASRNPIGCDAASRNSSNFDAADCNAAIVWIKIFKKNIFYIHLYRQFAINLSPTSFNSIVFDVNQPTLLSIPCKGDISL